MPSRIQSEARNVLEGYVSTHRDEEPDLNDSAAWKKAAALELAGRRLGVVKALSDETLQAIVDGTLDMPAIYTAAHARAAKKTKQPI